MLAKLGTPLLYLRVRSDSKSWYDYWFPLIASVVLTCAIGLSPVRVTLFGDGALVDHVLDLVQMLAGIFMGSLGIIAALTGKTLDQRMSGDDAPKERDDYGNDVALSRKRFLARLFGYLTFVSLMIYFVGVIGSAFADAVKSLISPAAVPYLRSSFVFVFVFLVANMFSVLGIGLHYLSDHLFIEEAPEPTPVEKCPQQDQPKKTA